jgi:acetylornithine deacetylase/succinyl-diaminopimelate desuccinylase family protein
MESVDSEELTSLAQDIVRIPSVYGDEEKVALFLANKFKQWGFEVTVDEVLPRRPNVYAVLRGKSESPTLMYNGHMDVVPPGDGWTEDPYSGLLRGGRLYGRGAADMKGPLASMMIAANALKRAQVELKGDLVITAVVGEEENQKGTLQVADRKMRADFAVVGEPTELKVCIAHKGDVTYEITTAGKAAHASVLHQGMNAIYKMRRIIEAIEKFSVELEARRSHPLLGTATISVGTIEGGTISSAVPAFCKIMVDRRTLPDEGGEKGKAELEGLVEKLRRDDSDLVAHVKTVVDALPMEIPEDHDLVRTIRRAAKEILGEDPEVQGVPYTTDGGILANRSKIPTLVFGPGDIGQAHRPDESIPVEEMFAAAKIYALTALHLLS